MELRTTPKFATVADFYNRYGINLDEELIEEGNQSNKANIFLLNVEELIIDYIEATSFRNYDWDCLTERQQLYLVQAILMEAKYLWENNDIQFDSGYDMEKGIILTPDQKEKVLIPDIVIRKLVDGVLLNHNIQNRFRHFHN